MIRPVLHWVMVAGASTCTYDQDAQIEALHLAARTLPQSTLDESARRITWTDARGSYVLTYGGCHHLGHQIIADVNADTLQSEGGFVAYAIALARRHWDAAEWTLLEEGLGENGRHVETREGSLRRIEVIGSLYDELSVTETPSASGVTVRVAWSRSF